MTIDACTQHPTRRLHVRLGRCYEGVIADFERVVPPIDPSRFQSLDAWDKDLRLFETALVAGFIER